MLVKVAILFTAGTNCDSETAYAFELAGAKVDLVHLSELKKRTKSLNDYSILAIPGGFTYGDYIAAGRILATELKYCLKEDIEKFIADGKLIIGICNGFQVLVKAGILPGINEGKPLISPVRKKFFWGFKGALPLCDNGYLSSQTVTLDANDSNRYEDRWVFLKNVKGNRCIFTKGIEELLYLPVAHAEGKFLVKDEKILKQLKKNGQVVLQYVDESGKKAGYPYNPNGSVDNIAGICDTTGRIFGLMPHPERFLQKELHPHWHRKPNLKPQGQLIFQNGVDYVRRQKV
uniref:Phosphoribosylformylglycinamidine synthase subunit PurQ n=1 Tax=candidate division WOR-3 bacterium TaxID=2052148 RepID=A0A7C6EE92_UNCW3